MKGYTNGTNAPGIIPSGKVNITSTSEVDVTNYASAQVVDANLVAGNIKQGATILGVAGSFTSDANAVAGDILSGKSGYVNGAKVNGSITSKAAQTYTPTTADQTIASGQYLSGAQTIAGDANLVAGNIKKDTTIFGVTGTYEGGGGGGTSIDAGFTFSTPRGTGGYITGFILGESTALGTYGWHEFDFNGETWTWTIDGQDVSQMAVDITEFTHASFIIFTSVYFRYLEGGSVRLYDGTLIDTKSAFGAIINKMCYLDQDTFLYWTD